MLLKPSTKLFERLRVMMEGEEAERVSGYDMELINRLAGGSESQARRREGPDPKSDGRSHSQAL